MKRQKINIQHNNNNDIMIKGISGKGIFYDVNMYEQQESNLCWASVTEALSLFFNVKRKKYTQTKFKQKYGNCERDLFPYINKLHDQSTINSCKTINKKPTFFDVKTLIENEGAPVVFAIPQVIEQKKCEELKDLHYVLIIGHLTDHKGTQYIILKDPMKKGRRYIPNKLVVEDVIPFNKFIKKSCGFLSKINSFKGTHIKCR